MNLRKIFTLVALMATTVSFAQMPTLPFDANVRKGTLPNGLTYYIRHNEWPEKRADFYIAQKVGSMQEEDDQVGLAHFLEHMCFNGTKNFPGTSLRTYLEKIGVKFGENLNAYTSFDETVYNINNVNVEIEGALDSSLLILHDWSHDLLLEDAEIDKERGVINEEWRARRSAMMRMYESSFPTIFEGSKYAHRMPIGTMDVVMNFKPDVLRAYYRKWYRPDLQAIVVVGDVDVDQMEEKIKTTFADIQMPENPAVREYYPVPKNAEPIFSVAKDKEQDMTQIMLMWKHDCFPEEMKNSMAYVAYNYMNNAIAGMYSDRISEILQKENPPFLGAQVGDGEFLVAKTMDAFTGVVVCKENGHKDAVAALYREILRATRHGFTVTEYERYKEEYKSRLDNAYEQRDKITNTRYVGELVSNFTDGEPVTGIEWEHQNMKLIADNVQVNIINQLLGEMVSDSNLVIAVFAPDKEDIILPTKEEILSILKEVAAEDIEAYKEEVSDEPLVSNLPKPGKIKKEEDGEFGTKVLTLSNGIKVWVKQTDFTPNQISMTAVSWGGNSLYADEEHFNSDNISMVTLGGAGNFSDIDLNKKLAGKQASASPGVGQNTESVSGGCVKKDLETMMQLTYLRFTAPRRDDEVFKSTISRVRDQLKNQDLDPTTALQDTIIKVVYNNNPRALRFKSEDVDKINYDRLLEMYKERFADADDFDFFFIGDIDMDALKPLLCQYIATLPVLKGKEKYKDISLKMAKGEATNVFEKEQETPNATVLFLYHAPMEYNMKNDVLVDFLDQVMDMMYTQTVREDEGGAYSVGVSGGLRPYPEEEAMFTITLPTAPEKRAYMTEIIYKGVEDIINNGPKEEDVQKVKEYLNRTYTENLKKNGYWSSIIQNKVRRNLDFHTGYLEFVNSVTPADIQAVAKKIFKSGNRIEVGMTSPVK
ncbi:MAG: insulinase family protein [Bacteroidaceae bacterium]|nr:insulinase family protein [Bacteroidaceae bacterium]